MVCSCGSGDQEAEETKGQEKVVKAPAMDLHTAAVLGDLDVIRQHAEAGSDMDVAEPSVGSSPLITAAVFNKPEAVKELLEGGADVNFQNREGSSALHTAAFLCRVEVVEILLENGADKTLKNNFGSTALVSVAGPFADVKPIYDIFSRDLGPLGLKFDYGYLEETRPVIAGMLSQ
jgi:ankyrin repeat protein